MSTFILKCKVLDFLPDMQINHISFNLEMHIVLVSLGRKEKEKKTQIKSLIDEGEKRHQMKFGTLALTLHTGASNLFYSKSKNKGSLLCKLLF